MSKLCLRALMFLVLLPGCAQQAPSSEASDAHMSGAADASQRSTLDGGHEASDDIPGEVDAPPSVEGAPGVQVVMDLDDRLSDPGRFYDHPWPSDLRLNGQGGPSISNLPYPSSVTLIDGVLPVAEERPGFPAIPVAWFRFDGALAPSSGQTPTLPLAESPVHLIDVDPDSPARGTRYPTMVRTLEPDPYVPENLLAISPWPGIVLPAGRQYAFVVLRDYSDADGAPLGVPLALAHLAAGEQPAGALALEAQALFQPLWETLDSLGQAREQVAAATVFTVGDVVAELHALSEEVRQEHEATIGNLAVHDEEDASHERFCVLRATLTVPGFQAGTPPYNSEGRFAFDDDERLIVQREDTFPLVITMPKGPMPPEGYPLVLYFHGSGGESSQVIDRGAVLEIGGAPTQGKGPAHVLAAHGFGTASSALPVNPERVSGASDFEYLNFNNLAAFRDTFRQGVLEQRLLLDALLSLKVSPEIVAQCEGMSLPEGHDAYAFSAAPVFGMGQSMGGMYTNMVGAVEPRLSALVPTGAGGFWSWFILETELLNAPPLLALVLETDVTLTFMHPALHLLETAWEGAEPLVFMPRLSTNPLPGHPARDVYEPVGLDDSYFPFQLFDAVALAYGHQQSGELVWDSMQDALALGGHEGLIDYPVRDNLSSASGESYTGVVVQYLGDGIYDPHSIFAQLDAVKYQYGCFFETALHTGAALVPAPQALGSPCPTVTP